MSVAGSRLVLEANAFQFVLNTARRDRLRLLDWFDRVALTPGIRGAYQEIDATGRTLEILVGGDRLVTCWADHAVKELRIVRVEKI